MDVLIFSLSLVLLFLSRKIEWPIVGMLILANNYLGIGGFFEQKGLNVFTHPMDLALVLLMIFIVVVIIRYKSVNESYEVKRMHGYIKLFLAYLVLITLIDLLRNNIGLWLVLRTSRHWLMLLMFIPLVRIPSDNLEKALKILYYITIIVSVIIVFEFLTGLYYFTEESYERYAGSMIVTRGALPSTYALFYVLMLAMGYGTSKRLVRYFIIALLTFSLLLSATRSIALGLFLGFAILMFLKSKSIVGAFNRILAVSVLALAVIVLLPSLRYRLIEGRNSFGNVDDGSITFRMLLVKERYNYIANDPTTYMFGIGNLTEDQFKGDFQIGHIDSEGRQLQLDTGDISWALVFLRLGIVGTVLWIGLTLMFVWCFMRRRDDLYSIPLVSYLLLNLVVLSLAGTTMYMAPYWIVPLICLNIVSQKNIMICLYEGNTY